MTVLELIRSTTAYFTRHAVESPRLNCEHLVAQALDCKRIDLYLQFDRPLFEAELQPLREKVRQRAQGVPLQHLLGTAEFHGRTFLCDRRGLIPRPETEQLVELVIERVLSLNLDQPRLLDVGTGSGVIALTLAGVLPNARVEAVDISPEALALAQENGEKLKLLDRVAFREGDLLAGTEGTFDVIIANLPYLAAHELPALSREVQHDPPDALAGGSDGLALIILLISQAKNHLRGGLLALEVGHTHAGQVQNFLIAEKYNDAVVATDHQGVSRFVFARYG